MAIVQDAYNISNEVNLKILTGEYKRFVSVVRQNRGEHKEEIIKHLKPVNLYEDKMRVMGV